MYAVMFHGLAVAFRNRTGQRYRMEMGGGKCAVRLGSDWALRFLLSQVPKCKGPVVPLTMLS